MAKKDNKKIKSYVVRELKKEFAVVKKELKVIQKQLGKRKYPRWDIALNVNCTAGNKFFTCVTRNISQGGVFLESDQGLAIGTKISLELKIIADESIKIDSKVVWTGSDGMGVKFQGSRHSLNKLKQILCSIKELEGILDKNKPK